MSKFEVLHTIFVYKSMFAPQKAYGAFESKLNSILNDIAPIKRMRIKNKTSKWINQNIPHLIEEKNAAKHTAKKSKDDVDIYKSYKSNSYLIRGKSAIAFHIYLSMKKLSMTINKF